LELEELILRGKKLENNSKEDLFTSKNYVQWMTDVNYIFKTDLKNSIFKDEFEKAYFYKNSRLKNSLYEIISILELIMSKSEGEITSMKEKIFISHSSKDKELAKEFVNFMKTSFEINNRKIFCTSLNGSLGVGDNFITKIKKEIAESAIIIFLITPNYLSSKFCLCELGAAWALDQNIFPILCESASIDDLNATPLLGTQCVKLDDEENMIDLAQMIVSTDLADSQSLLDYKGNLKNFLKLIDAK